MTLLPWGNERYSTSSTPLNEGYPDWEGHSNSLSFDYPGALPKVNPMIRIPIKCERSLLSGKKTVLGVVQVPLRKFLVAINQYNDNWYPVFKNGAKTDGKVRVSFMFCPDPTKTSGTPSGFLSPPSV